MKKRIISMLLLGAMMLTLAACGGEKKPAVETTAPTQESVENSLPAGIEKKNYGKEFTILYKRL